jgi:hypothetical protein
MSVQCCAAAESPLRKQQKQGGAKKNRNEIAEAKKKMWQPGSQPESSKMNK